jgi:Kef-type K+ transport system membrane component KefB
MNELALLLLIAAAGHGLALWTGAPSIPILLGLGMVLSFTGIVDHPTAANAAGSLDELPFFTMLELGLTVLVFSSGLELNPQRFIHQRRAVLWVGLLQFFSMGTAGFFTARLLGFEDVHALYLGFAVSASSTIVALRQLQSAQQSYEPHGRMVIGVLLLQDALTIAILVGLAHWADGAFDLFLGYASAFLMAGAAWLLQRGGARWLLERCRDDEESMLLAVLTVLFLFLGAAHLAGLPIIVGAFLAGYALSSFPVSGLVGGLLLSLVDFFRAIFLVALGALVVVPQAGMVSTALILAALVIIITPPLVTVVAEWAGFNTRPSIESGLLLAQTSEYSLVLGFVGMRLGHLESEIFAIVAMMAVITMTCTPLLARDAVARQLLRFHPSRRKKQLPTLEISGHVLVLGLGSSGMWVLRPFLAAKDEVLVVDVDPLVIDEMDRKGIPCLRGDGSDERILDRAGANRARLIIASMPKIEDAKKVLASVTNVPVVVRLFEDQDAEEIRRLGGIPVSNAEAAAAEFMKWFESHG